MLRLVLFLALFIPQVTLAEVILVFRTKPQIAATIEAKKKLTQISIKNLAQDLNLTTALFEPIWIGNAARVKKDLDRETFRKLSLHPLVESVVDNQKLRPSLPDLTIFQIKKESLKQEMPYYFRLTNLDQLISKKPYLDGSNVNVGIIDTGVDSEHPTFKNKIKIFYDADEDKIVDKGSDSSGHGTHVAGLIVGGSRDGQHLGIAPKAQLVVAKITTIASALKAMEFMVQQKVRVVNNSWGEKELPDLELFYRALDCWQQLGVIGVFSSGKEGPKEFSISHPKEHPATIVVGAIDEFGKLASYSSRGYSIYKGRITEKPDLVAPGDKIVSALPNGNFGPWSGTSMAAPMVTGTIALMLQIKPTLTLEQVRKILINTVFVPDATEVADPTLWDRGYGWGKLNILGAIEAVDAL